MKSKRIYPVHKSIIFKLIISIILLFIAMTLVSNFVVARHQEKLINNLYEQLGDSLPTDKINDEVLLILDDKQLKLSSVPTVAELNADFMIYSICVVTITILLGTLIFFFIILHLMRPLKTLTEKVSQIDMDTLDIIKNQSLLTNSSYELEQLSRNFDIAFKKIYENYENQKQFSNNVAHELRTPIAVLRTKVDVYKKEHQNPNEYTDAFIKTMDSNLIRLSNLVEGMLLLSRNSLGDVTSVDLNELIEEILLDLEDSAAEKDVSLSISGDDIKLTTDDILIERALFNLIDNAIKYNVRGGHVAVHLSDSKNDVEIKISDTGIGISDDDKPHVFDLLYRTDVSRNRQTGGYGIGLALVKNILTKLGATISISDNAPQGSIFTIIIEK